MKCKRIALSFFTAFIIVTSAFAQGSKMLTMEEAVIKQRTTLAPEKLSQLAFLPGTHRFSWVGKRDSKECLIISEAQTQSQDTVLSIDQFRSMLDATGSARALPDRFPFITWISGDKFRFMYDNAFYLADLTAKNIRILNGALENGEGVEFEPVSNRLAFLTDNNIVVFDQESGLRFRSGSTGKIQMQVDEINRKEVQMITNDGTFGLLNGHSVHRNEFGITKGLFWSPEGERLAYYKMYEGMVTDYPLLNIEKKPAQTKNIKYPMSGGQTHHVKVMIYDFKKKMNYAVNVANTPEQYLTNVSFSPDGESIYIAVVNRDQNKMDFNRYDAVTGAFIRTLFTETSTKYVEPQNNAEFLKNKPGYFIWQSRRDGYNHLYLYSSRGEMVKQLTQGKFDVTEFAGFNDAGTAAWYVAATNNGLDRQYFSLNLETGRSTQLTKGPGVHSVVISSDGAYFIDSYSNITTPRRSTLMDEKGTELSILLNPLSPIRDYKNCGIRISDIPSTDGTVKLNCRTFYPPQFDSTRKYPAIIYLYGGPHAQMVTNSWLGGADMWLYYMAQQGYVVFTLDNRGSGNRGAEFEQATFRRLGTVEREDQLAGVSFLKKQKYIDTGRLGVFGWSFGGFMSINMMTRTDEFKVAVAGGPVIDWSMYEIMYTERYMDKPQENPDGYKEANLLNYVKDLKGKMMLIHGTDDDVVLWQHSLSYLKKCVDEGVQLDYFVYPGHKHNVLGKDRVHLMQKVTDYFKQNL